MAQQSTVPATLVDSKRWSSAPILDGTQLPVTADPSVILCSSAFSIKIILSNKGTYFRSHFNAWHFSQAAPGFQTGPHLI